MVDLIKAKIKERGLSVDKAAVLCGMTKCNFPSKRIDRNGNYRMGWDKLIHVLDVLGYDVEFKIVKREN